MKRIIVFLTVIAIAVALIAPAAVVNAEEATNYLTAKWSTSLFSGTLTESEEDGATVTTYQFSSKQSWISPNISVYDDIKKLAEGKDYVEIVFSFEIRGIFSGDGNITTLDTLLRAVNPRTSYITYPATDAENWDGEGNTWQDLFDEASDGEVRFFLDSGGNCMLNLEPTSIQVFGDEWTLFESDPIYFPAEVFNDDLYSDWLWCLHQIEFGTNLEEIQIRNAAIYDYNEGRKTPAPTEVSTKAPADEATEAAPTAVVTDNAPATADSGDNASQATDKTDDPSRETDNSSGVNPGVIIGIVCGTVVIVACVLFFVLRKKKK